MSFHILQAFVRLYLWYHATRCCQLFLESNLNFTPSILPAVYVFVPLSFVALSLRLSNTKTVFKYSGARGLGWNIAQALAESGASAIALLDVKQNLGDNAAAELHSTTGIPVQFYKVDVRDETAITDVVTKITSDLGIPNIVINSAGVVE